MLHFAYSHISEMLQLKILAVFSDHLTLRSYCLCITTAHLAYCVKPGIFILLASWKIGNS